VTLSQWNGFDWLLATIVVFSIVRAVMTGLVRAIFGLLGLIGGFELASWTYTEVGDRLNETRWITSQPIARVLAFLVIATAVAIGFDLVGRGLQKSLRAIGLSAFDRILGGAFGFGRGCLVGIGLLMATATFLPQSQLITTSALSPYLFEIAHEVSFLVPQYLQQTIIDGTVDLRQNAPHWAGRH
jgi:membrane protein required for colicin V production